jgi:hypothetical protein
MLDPRLARTFMSKPTTANMARLGEYLKYKARAIGIGATYGATEGR